MFPVLGTRLRFVCRFLFSFFLKYLLYLFIYTRLFGLFTYAQCENKANQIANEPKVFISP